MGISQPSEKIMDLDNGPWFFVLIFLFLAGFVFPISFLSKSYSGAQSWALSIFLSALTIIGIAVFTIVPAKWSKIRIDKSSGAIDWKIISIHGIETGHKKISEASSVDMTYGYTIEGIKIPDGLLIKFSDNSVIRYSELLFSTNDQIKVSRFMGI